MLMTVKEALCRAVEPAALIHEWMREGNEDPRIADLRVGLRELEERVVEALARSLSALGRRDAAIAGRVEGGDDRIDSIELRLRRQCNDFLVSGDSMPGERNLVLILMHTGAALERIADHAVEIGSLARELSYRLDLEPPKTLWEMGELVTDMALWALAAFSEANTRLAYKLCAQEERVHAYQTQVTASLVNQINTDRKFSMQGIFYLFAVNHLEQIADMATDIGERVIHWRTGQTTRLRVHRG